MLRTEIQFLFISNIFFKNLNFFVSQNSILCCHVKDKSHVSLIKKRSN